MKQLSTRRRRVLVVSHPAVVTTNQMPYLALEDHGWSAYLVVPATWRHEYTSGRFAPGRLPGVRGRTLRIVLAGRVQRHAYLAHLQAVLREVDPEIVFVEEEPTSVAGAQWAVACVRRGIPFGLQVDENLRRPYPLPARVFRKWTLARASFIAARSPTAAALVEEHRPGTPAPLVPHHVPTWTPVEPARRSGVFTVGYAGRLVPEKGLDTLVEAIALATGMRLRLIGDGPDRNRLISLADGRVDLEIESTASHETMAVAYAALDVLVLPSRTTPTWAEQFGRVLVEALSCGVPVVGSDSGEIPWVIESTGGGLVFPEGDSVALRDRLVRLRDNPGLRRLLAAKGSHNVEQTFSVDAVASALGAVLSEASRGGSWTR